MNPPFMCPPPLSGGCIEGVPDEDIPMSVIESGIDIRSPLFQANAAAMRALVEDLRAKVAAVGRGGDEAARARHTARATPRAASCSRASASPACSTRARPFSRSASLPRSVCTATRRRVRGSLPASAGSKAANA